MKRIKLETAHLEAVLYYENQAFALVENTTGDTLFTSLQTKDEVIHDLQPDMMVPSEGEADIFEIHELYGQIALVMSRDLGEELTLSEVIFRHRGAVEEIFRDNPFRILGRSERLIPVEHELDNGTTALYQLLPRPHSGDTLVMHGENFRAHLVGTIPYCIDDEDKDEYIYRMLSTALKTGYYAVETHMGDVLLTRATDTEMAALKENKLVLNYRRIKFQPFVEFI